MIKDSIKVLKTARNTTQKHPTFIITDGCVSYSESIKLVLGNINHIRLTSITDKRTNNNVWKGLMER